MEILTTQLPHVVQPNVDALEDGTVYEEINHDALASLAQ